MIEVFELLINDIIEIYYNAHWNNNFIEENQDLILRCADRADIVFMAYYTEKFIFLEYFFGMNCKLNKVIKYGCRYDLEIFDYRDLGFM
jgi:hypothetical protein